MKTTFLDGFEAASHRPNDERDSTTSDSTEGTSSTRNKSRFRMPRLFADAEKISAEELQQAVPTAAPASQPECVQWTDTFGTTRDQGVTYTYYRGIKTAVIRPGTHLAASDSSAVAGSGTTMPLAAESASGTSSALQSDVQQAQPDSSEAQPLPESALHHEMEQLRAGMLEISRRLQQIQAVQQASHGQSEEPQR